MFNPKKPETVASTLSNTMNDSAPQPITSRNAKPTHSIVDECLTMRGDLESDGDIIVKGKVYGNITCKLLIIDSEALVEGGINAQEVVVRGRAKGDIRADRVSLERTADIDCDIYQKTFAAEEGARIRGALKSLDDQARPAAQTSGKKSAQKVCEAPVAGAEAAAH